jgi:hypothetical protein
MAVVFGYGAVIPIEDFVRVFPDSFVFENEYGGCWCEENIDQYKSNLIKFHYSTRDDELEQPSVFITTKSAEEYYVDKGCFINPYTLIKDINNIIHEGNILSPWLQKYFPKAPVGLMMYGSP